MRSFVLVLLLTTAIFDAPPLFAGPVWKSVLVAGDDSAEVFDNARWDLGRHLLLRGVKARNLIDLSVSDEEGAMAATIGNLRYALKSLSTAPGDACLLHLTSHGTPEGLFLAFDDPLTPETLDEILESSCAGVPTVVLVSACYSGIFVEPVMRRPNRIILTASRGDLPSFGCDDRGEYNFWDECLLDNIPRASTWSSLFAAIRVCVNRKEKRIREKGSFPQAYFGESVADLEVPSLDWNVTLPPERLYDLIWDTHGSCRAREPFGLEEAR